MKKLIILLTAVFCSSIALAQEQKVRFPSAATMTVEEIISLVEQQTGMSVAYNEAGIDVARNISVESGSRTLNEVFGQILNGTGYTIKVQGKIVAIIREGSEHTYTGVVRDDIAPIPGAVVMLKDDPNAAQITDLDGRFSIKAKEGSVLKVSIMGYKDAEVLLGHQMNNLDILLHTDIELLTESVVVGYGVQKKVNLTGAVAAVDQDQLQDRPVASVGQALQGVVPNLNITNTSGRPGESSNFNIRGNTSPNGGNPLILVDGVETDLGRINANDIASISVLKDASSAAIYGARGAFGVILVTTKSGDFDKAPTVTADARFSVSAPTTSTDYETRGYYHAKIADLFMETNSGVPYTNYTSYDYQRLWERRNDVTEHPDRPWVVTEMRNGRLEYVYLANFDWYNYMYDDSRPTQDYNVSVRGGSKNVSYMVSGRYYHQDGIFRIGPDDYDSFNTRAKVDVKICPWLKLTSNTRFFHSKYHYAGNEYRRPTLHALASFVPVNPDGTFVSHTSLTQSAAHYIMDGYSAMLHKGVQYGNQKITELTTSWILTADITDKLKFNVDFSYKFGYFRSPYRDATVQYSQYPGEIATESTLYIDRISDTVNEHNDYIANAYLSYADTWKKDHDFTGTVGVNYEARKYNDMSVRRNDLLTEELSDFNLAVGNLDNLTGGGKGICSCRSVLPFYIRMEVALSIRD